MRNFDIGNYYHVYNRGADKRIIFLDDRDRERFLVLMCLCNSTSNVNISELIKKGRTFIDLYEVEREKTLVDIGAYCLMDNHFHFILKEVLEGGVTLYMKKICTGYSMYFNKRYIRSGTLFQGKFKAKNIETDNYFKRLLSYIHLNPVDLSKDINSQLMNYKYSSYVDHYIKSARVEEKILNKKSIPDYCVSVEDWNNEVMALADIKRSDLFEFNY